MNPLARCILGVLALVLALSFVIIARVDHELALDLMPGVLAIGAVLVAAEVVVTKWRHDHGQR